MSSDSSGYHPPNRHRRRMIGDDSGRRGERSRLMRAVDAWNSGDVESYLELYGQRLALHAGTYDFPDMTSVERMYKGFFAGTSDLRLTIHGTFGHEDKLCARYAVTGRHTGKLMGMEPTGA